MKSKIDLRYEDDLFVNKYIALWAYGYMNGYGESEGLYSCITRMCTLLTNSPENILDIGCGIGRTAFDLAQIFPKAKILGIDQSDQMIKYAQLINTEYYKDRLIDIHDISILSLRAPSFNYKNVIFVANTFECYCEENKNITFDLITNVNYLDRCLNIKDNIRLMYSFLNKNGSVVGATPLNFRDFNKAISKKKLLQLFESAGFKCEMFFDDVIYREILDQRKSVEEYKVLCYKMQKT